jgi:hypothetical protein
MSSSERCRQRGPSKSPVPCACSIAIRCSGEFQRASSGWAFAPSTFAHLITNHEGTENTEFEKGLASVSFVSPWFVLFGFGVWDLGFGIYEKPIHRPPHPTVDHNKIDVTPTMRIQNGPTPASPASATRRRTVKLKMIARASAVILVQNAKL